MSKPCYHVRTGIERSNLIPENETNNYHFKLLVEHDPPLMSPMDILKM